jgi:hypothetical protein
MRRLGTRYIRIIASHQSGRASIYRNPLWMARGLVRLGKARMWAMEGENPTYCFTSMDSLVTVPSAEEPPWDCRISISNLPPRLFYQCSVQRNRGLRSEGSGVMWNATLIDTEDIPVRGEIQPRSEDDMHVSRDCRPLPGARDRMG